MMNFIPNQELIQRLQDEYAYFVEGIREMILEQMANDLGCKLDLIGCATWDKSDTGHLICSNCGMAAPKNQLDKIWRSPFCPNCGYHMLRDLED